jgi:hypothetical protein
MTAGDALRAKAIECLSAALEADIRAELIVRRPALLAACDQTKSAAQDAADRYAVADGISRALRDELLAVRRYSMARSVTVLASIFAQKPIKFWCRAPTRNPLGIGRDVLRPHGQMTYRGTNHGLRRR